MSLLEGGEGGEYAKTTVKANKGGECDSSSMNSERAKHRRTWAPQGSLGPKQLEGGEGIGKAEGLGLSKLEGGEGGEHAKTTGGTESSGQGPGVVAGQQVGHIGDWNEERARASMTRAPQDCLGPQQQEGGGENEKAERLGVSLVGTNPSVGLSARYFSRPEDLGRLDSEEQVLMKLAQNINQCWKKELDENNNKDEVKVFGNVELTEDEIELLNLGPGFMIVSDLDQLRCK